MTAKRSSWIPISLILIIVFNFNLNPKLIASRDSLSRTNTEPQRLVKPQSHLVINQSQVWYGDFSVNATDIVIIKDCNFTVENGMIYVYGTFEITNSTILMRHTSSKRKNIYIYGNFTIVESRILKDNQIRCYPNSKVSIVNSYSPTTQCYTEDNSEVSVYNSTLYAMLNWGGNVSFLHSYCQSNLFYFYPNSKLSAEGSNITYVYFLGFCYEGDLAIQPGLFDKLIIYSEIVNANFTLIDTEVSWWALYCSGFEGRLLNSVIGEFDFGSFTNGSENLTLTSGFTEYVELNVTDSHIIIANSTIDEWRMGVFGNASVHLNNSENIIIDIGNSAMLSIFNTSAIFLQAHEFYSGTLFAANTSFNSLSFRFQQCQLNLTLHEGFHETFQLLFPESSINVTLVNSTVSHWWILPHKSSSLSISNSILTKDEHGWCPYNLMIYANASCSVINSSLQSVYCSGLQGLYPSLEFVNCTIDTLYAYYGANITAINSTINMLITDPIYIHLINSFVMLELDFSFEMTEEDSIFSSFIEDFNPSLPQDIQRFSKYINITTAFEDHFEVQVRIYYDETQVTDAGINEARLRMYVLNETYAWQLCDNQGVNVLENYVWSNVTYFSCFVLGNTSAQFMPWDITGPTMWVPDWKCDIRDVALVALLFGSVDGDGRYETRADITGPEYLVKDGKIDIRDIALVALHFGEEYT